MLYQIAYVSAAAEPMDQEALEALVRQSRKRDAPQAKGFALVAYSSYLLLQSR